MFGLRAGVHREKQPKRVYIRHVLTRAEYDRGFLNTPNLFSPINWQLILIYLMNV